MPPWLQLERLALLIQNQVASYLKTEMALGKVMAGRFEVVPGDGRVQKPPDA